MLNNCIDCGAGDPDEETGEALPCERHSTDICPIHKTPLNFSGWLDGDASYHCATCGVTYYQESRKGYAIGEGRHVHDA